MKYTTLNKIKERSPCQDVWKKLLKHLGKTKADDELLPFAVILESNGLADALWCTRAAPEYSKEWRGLAIAYARRVQHLMKDPRSIKALDVAEAFLKGEATQAELDKARKDAAYYAADAAAAAAYAYYADADAERAAQTKLFLELVQ